MQPRLAVVNLTGEAQVVDYGQIAGAKCTATIVSVQICFGSEIRAICHPRTTPIGAKAMHKRPN